MKIDSRLPVTNSDKFNLWFIKTSIYKQMYGNPDLLIAPVRKVYNSKEEIILVPKQYYKTRFDDNGDPLEIGKGAIKKSAINTTSKVAPLRKKMNGRIFTCCYCEILLNQTNYTRDHLIPISKGGGDEGENLRPCCSACNSEKGSLSLREYIIHLNILFANISKDNHNYEVLQVKIKNANILASET